MNKYIYIGDNKIAGPLEKKKPMFSAWDMMANDATGQADRKIKEFETYIAFLPKIEVVKEPTHSWEINQILVEDVDFKFMFYCWKYAFGGHYTKDKKYYDEFKDNKKIVAVPISKPNTDLKGDGLQKYRDNVDNRPCHGIAIEKAITEAYIPNKLQEIFDACSEEEKAAFNKSKIVRSEPNPVKEVERIYSKEDMIDFPEWILNNCRMGSFNWKLLSEEGKGIEYASEQLFNLYTRSPEFKNNQK